MIALRATVSSVSGGRTLGEIHRRLERLRSVRVGPTETIVLLPAVGSVVVGLADGRLSIDVVVEDASGLPAVIRGVEAALGCSGGVVVSWAHLSAVPVLFR